MLTNVHYTVACTTATPKLTTRPSRLTDYPPPPPHSPHPHSRTNTIPQYHNTTPAHHHDSLPRPCTGKECIPRDDGVWCKPCLKKELKRVKSAASSSSTSKSGRSATASNGKKASKPPPQSRLPRGLPPPPKPPAQGRLPPPPKSPHARGGGPREGYNPSYGSASESSSDEESDGGMDV
jgi:hypothetical protein